MYVFIYLSIFLFIFTVQELAEVKFVPICSLHIFTKPILAQNRIALMMLKFVYSEKATKFCEISTLLLSMVHTDKSKVEISQKFVAFSEYMNFKYKWEIAKSELGRSVRPTSFYGLSGCKSLTWLQ